MFRLIVLEKLKVWYLLHLLVDHIPVLIVAEHLLDEEAREVLGDALFQPLVAPFLGRDEASVELVGDRLGRYRPRLVHLGPNFCVSLSL